MCTSESRQGHQFIAVREMVNCLDAIFFKATNELRNSALTTHNNESFYLLL